MATRKHDWMMASLQHLVEQGVDSMTIASLTERLGVTKGSFYHHFKDMQDFKTQMLAMCLEESTTSVINRANVGATPYDRLMLLEEMAAANDPLEVAIRAWALRDEQAHATLAEIDARRIAYITGLFEANGLTPSSAAQSGRLFYAAFIGGLHMMPPLSETHMRENFRIIRGHYGIY